MFLRISVAVLADIALVGSLLSGPGVAAIPVVGRAATWGDNDLGQLGNNGTTDSSVPVAVDTSGALVGRTVTGISAGNYHMCAVADGKAFCWGHNNLGQLGNNSTTDSMVPVAVDTSGALSGRTVTAISAGNDHTCAVADGRAFCWGHNGSGRLGNNSTTDTTVPVAVDTSGVLAGKTVTAVIASYLHTCAVAEGRAFCWGSDGFEQLGNGSGTDSTVPVAVDTSGVLAGRTVTAVSAGDLHNCAVADGKAYCWGYNFFGQLGNSSNTDSNVPVAVNTLGPLASRTVTAVSAGGHHSCVVAEGRASCWGYNSRGELGNNSTTGSNVPVAVTADSGPLAGKTVTSIAASVFHSCAIAGDKAFCWGYNYTGQLGNDSTTNSLVPVAVDTGGVLAGRTVTAITAGGLNSAVLAATPPLPPTAVNGVPGDGQVSVSWAAPVDNGGSPLLDYTATAIPGGATCTSTSTNCTVTGLTNGTPYTFTATARNALGMSMSSAPSAPVIPTATVIPPPATLQPPGKVTGAKATFHKRTVKITWNAVPGATSYRVRISKPGRKTYMPWRTTSKQIVKAKVRKSAKYRAQIVAVGPGGRGPVTTLRFKST